MYVIGNHNIFVGDQVSGTMNIHHVCSLYLSRGQIEFPEIAELTHRIKLDSLPKQEND